MRDLVSALLLLLVMTVLTGGIYPLAVTGIAQVAFRGAANGSLIESKGSVVGSEIIGQAFSGPGYFWSRPSATGPAPYNAGASTGSNMGPTSPSLRKSVEERIAALKEADPTNRAPIPVDLVTASASGLDPHISPEAARYQLARVARARGLPEGQVSQTLERHIEGREIGLFGEPRVNVLRLNLALDAMSAHQGS